MRFVSHLASSFWIPVTRRKIIFGHYLAENNDRCSMDYVREKVLTDERLHPQSALVVEWFVVWKSLKKFFDISISHDPDIMPKSMIKKSLSNAILHPSCSRKCVFWSLLSSGLRNERSSILAGGLSGDTSCLLLVSGQRVFPVTVEIRSFEPSVLPTGDLYHRTDYKLERRRPLLGA